MKTLHEQLCEFGLVGIYDYCRTYRVSECIVGYAHCMPFSANPTRFYEIRLPHLDNPIITFDLKKARAIEVEYN